MKYAAIVFLSLMLLACQKEPGAGGNAKIIGQLQAIDVVVGAPADTTWIGAEDVYLIYGEDVEEAYDDSYETSWNGKFEFEYLRKGTYTVFVYSENYPTNNDLVPVFTTVEITKNGEVVDLGTITIYN